MSEIDESKVIDVFAGPYEFLSNFYLAEVPFEGRTYPSVEHAYQAAKIADDVNRGVIANAVTPGDAKRIGRKVNLRPNWEAYWKHAVMRQLIAVKFSHTALAEALIATGNALLIEGNTWHDNTWGDCRCGHPLCKKQGQNLLGVSLMRRREAIRP